MIPKTTVCENCGQSTNLRHYAGNCEHCQYEIAKHREQTWQRRRWPALLAVVLGFSGMFSSGIFLSGVLSRLAYDASIIALFGGGAVLVASTLMARWYAEIWDLERFSNP